MNRQGLEPCEPLVALGQCGTPWPVLCRDGGARWERWAGGASRRREEALCPCREEYQGPRTVGHMRELSSLELGT